jgi:hypothetical protein
MKKKLDSSIDETMKRMRKTKALIETMSEEELNANETIVKAKEYFEKAFDNAKEHTDPKKAFTPEELKILGKIC